jgi:UDP-N-acetyl-D-galactosamine dehydrogenase
VNIALINELAQLFNRLGIDTQEVLEAAGTKWNFLQFQPGLVGGHCIGVDPYYLTHKARAVGFHPEVILAGRRINDSMGSYVASELVKALLRHGIDARGGRILLMGLAFKENTPDLRNTRVIDIYRELTAMGLVVDIYDPWADPREALDEYGLLLTSEPEVGAYQGVVLTVAHDQFKKLGADGIRKYGQTGSVLYDLKGILPASQSDLRL